MARRKNDFYPTPANLTLALIDELSAITYKGSGHTSSVYEPCAGKLAISDVFVQVGCKVTTADIDPTMKVDHILDATREHPAQLKIDWVITNPPFNQAIHILKHFHPMMLTGRIAKGIGFLLRLSFLEPVEDRSEFLKANPPSKLIVLPRTSFTEDGKTDSVTCAWMVWEREHSPFDYRIKVYTKEDLKRLEEQWKSRKS